MEIGIPTPGIENRDFIVYGFGVNNIKINNSFLILCRSIDGLDIYKKYQKQKSGVTRGKIQIFGFEVTILSLTKISIKGLVDTDPNMKFIPQWLMDFASKQVLI